MDRVAVIERALAALAPPRTCANSLPRLDRDVLKDMMRKVRYIVWPSVTHPPAVPPHVDLFNRFEWILRDTTDILVAQVQCAFIMHGDARAVEPSPELKPAPTWERQADQPSPRQDDEFFKMCRQKALAITEHFVAERLPHLRWLLNTDAEIAFANDVAATSISEVIHTYPGVRCMLYQRVAHELYLLGVPNSLTRALTEIAHSITGIDIHPHTSIGHHFFIDHGTGIVIGATAIIGNYVSLYQGVTLGARSFPVDKETGEKIKNLPRHPIIEDYVTIYANAVVLGRITIGRNSTIGGNVWVVQSLPANTTIVQKANRVLETKQSMLRNIKEKATEHFFIQLVANTNCPVRGPQLLICAVVIINYFFFSATVKGVERFIRMDDGPPQMPILRVIRACTPFCYQTIMIPMPALQSPLPEDRPPPRYERRSSIASANDRNCCALCETHMQGVCRCWSSLRQPTMRPIFFFHSPLRFLFGFSVLQAHPRHDIFFFPGG
eukprot:gene7312-5153_t